ncbi:hypothetical protein ACFS07_08160 [Undibacterium arcticum]
MLTNRALSSNAKGVLYASAAAALHGTIGVFSKFLMERGGSWLCDAVPVLSVKPIN